MIYQDADTLLHRLNPAAKIVALLLFFAWAVAPTDLWAAALPFAFAALTASGARAWGNVRKVWFVLVLLFAFSVVFWTLQSKGESAWFRLGGLQVYREAVRFACAVGLRLCAMLIAGVVLLTCTRVEEFALGLQQLRVPYPVAFTFSLAFRLVPAFAATAATIAQAQRARGHDLDRGNLLVRLRKHAPLLIPVLISAVRNSDLMAMALEARGFHPTRPRTPYLDIPFTPRDLLVILLLFAFALAAWWLRLSGIGVVAVVVK